MRSTETEEWIEEGHSELKLGGVRWGATLPSCQANAIWAAHWCYWGPGAVPRIHMIMKPGAIQSAGLKLALRAFDSPQQPVGLPTLDWPAFLPGPNHLFDFPRARPQPRLYTEGTGRGRKGMSL
uniref:Uncharacterized protein n=1 Tax=Knipowitschia caucasica TaxID=637954 RepID=A0AAV2M5Z8_KNICA